MLTRLIGCLAVGTTLTVGATTAMAVTAPAASAAATTTAAPAAAPTPATAAAPVLGPGGPTIDVRREPVTAETLAPALDLGPRHAPRSHPLRTDGFKMVAVTWFGEPERDYLIRTRSSGAGWSAWRTAHSLHGDSPDAGTPEARSSRVNGSDLLWVGESDGVQVRAPGGRPRGLRVVLIDPGTRASDATAARTAVDTDPGTDLDAGGGSAVTPAVWSPAVATSAASAAAARTVAAPRLRYRQGWGADESWRSSDPTYNTSMKQAHIHHTAGSNQYTKADVPGIIRGIYRYHTKSLGWSDIGYNFLVDRFGRAWVGRAGGSRRWVRGAHTLGFNHQSVGLAVIGDFERTRPTEAVLRKLAHLAAWKLDGAGRRPSGWSVSTSLGSDKYPRGTNVRLRAIDGHRDTNDTACPGRYLYDRLPRIRYLAQQRADNVG